MNPQQEDGMDIYGFINSKDIRDHLRSIAYDFFFPGSSRADLAVQKYRGCGKKECIPGTDQ